MPGDRITLGVSLPAGDSVTQSEAEQPATIYVVIGRRTPKIVRGSRFSPQTRRQLGKGNFRGKKTTTNRALFPSPLPIEQHALHFMNFKKPHRTQNRTGGRQAWVQNSVVYHLQSFRDQIGVGPHFP